MYTNNMCVPTCCVQRIFSSLLPALAISFTTRRRVSVRERAGGRGGRTMHHVLTLCHCVLFVGSAKVPTTRSQPRQPSPAQPNPAQPSLTQPSPRRTMRATAGNRSKEVMALEKGKH